MPSPNVDHAAVNRLREFLGKMNAWEWEMIKEDFGDLEELPPEQIEAEVNRRRAVQVEQLAMIMDEYCDIGRKADRVAKGMHWGGSEPNYNPQNEEVVSVQDHGDQVIIETHNVCNHMRYEYKLVKRGNQWRIIEPRRYKDIYDKRWNVCGL